MSYASEVLADSPVAWYRMQEASGLLQDSSGNANHANSSSGSAVYRLSGPINETGDYAVNFDADPTYFSVPDHATLDLGDVFTLECWAKRSETGTIQVIFSKGSGSGELAFNASDTVALHKTGTSQIVASTSTITDTAAYHHLVAVKNGASSAIIYIDGADVSGSVTDEPCTSTGDPLILGSEAGGSLCVNALLDEIALYGTPLSAARVLAHYQAATSTATESAIYQSDRLRKSTIRIS